MNTLEYDEIDGKQLPGWPWPPTQKFLPYFQDFLSQRFCFLLRQGQYTDFAPFRTIETPKLMYVFLQQKKANMDAFLFDLRRTST